MELEVGMYVRFKDKRGNTYIRKIIDIPKDNRYASIYIDKEANYTNNLSFKNVLKASHNIIDLIEVGDYVNGSKVVDISIIGKDKEKWVWVEQMEDTDNKYGDDYVGYNNEQIKSIVTKEQFESMSYRIGE